MLNSEPIETAGPKPHLLSGLLQYAHTREAWKVFSFSPLSPQGKNWEEKRVSLSNPTAKQETPGLVVRSGHDSVKGWVLWTHQVMNGRFHWESPLQTCINHYCVLYWGFSNWRRIFVFSPASFWHYCPGRGTVTASLLPLGSYLGSLWEEAHLWHTKPWEEWQQMSL